MFNIRIYFLESKVIKTTAIGINNLCINTKNKAKN